MRHFSLQLLIQGPARIAPEGEAAVGAVLLLSGTAKKNIAAEIPV